MWSVKVIFLSFHYGTNAFAKPSVLQYRVEMFRLDILALLLAFKVGFAKSLLGLIFALSLYILMLKTVPV